MRCKYCDYSPSAPSEFHTGLRLAHRPWTRLKEDRREGGYVCTNCYDSVGEALREFEDVNEPMDFNSPALSVWDEQ